MAIVAGDLLLWATFIRTMPKSVRRALKRLLVSKVGRDKVSDLLELEVFPKAPWFDLDSEGNQPKEWDDG